MSAVSVATRPPPPRGAARRPGQPSRSLGESNSDTSRIKGCGSRDGGPWGIGVLSTDWSAGWDQLARVSEFRRF